MGQVCCSWSGYSRKKEKLSSCLLLPINTRTNFAIDTPEQRLRVLSIGFKQTLNIFEASVVNFKHISPCFVKLVEPKAVLL